MQLQAPCSQDVHDRIPSGDQCISDERAMTPPGESLGTHEREGSILLSTVDEFVECRGELCSLHMVGKATEAGIAPGGIRGVGPRLATSTECRAVPVRDTMFSQCAGQAIPVELGVTPRVRETPHIGHEPHAMRSEQLEELGEGAVGMADREDRPGPPARRLRSTGVSVQAARRHLGAFRSGHRRRGRPTSALAPRRRLFSPR